MILSTPYLGEDKWKWVNTEKAKPMLDVFWACNRDTINNNLMVEKNFTVPLGEYQFKGFIDRIDLIPDRERKVEIIATSQILALPFSKEAETAERRKRQATRIAEIIRERFDSNVKNANFAVFGDFNDTPDAECLKPILDGSIVENVVVRLPKNEQWTHYWEAKHEINQFDYILLSRALSKKNPTVFPKIERRGLANYAKAYKGPRFPGVGKKGTEASDHCAVFMEINI